MAKKQIPPPADKHELGMYNTLLKVKAKEKKKREKKRREGEAGKGRSGETEKKNIPEAPLNPPIRGKKKTEYGKDEIDSSPNGGGREGAFLVIAHPRHFKWEERCPWLLKQAKKTKPEERIIDFSRSISLQMDGL